jgi:nucleotide-binding universal stress UspA family protein
MSGLFSTGSGVEALAHIMPFSWGMAGPVILCPVDFSRASRGALRYAFAIAEHFGARLALLTVNDPLLQEATELRLGGSWLEARTRRELVRFHERATSERRVSLQVTTHVATGKPAPEILTRAREEGANLASPRRGRRMGSVTYRVLCLAHTLVLAVPPAEERGGTASATETAGPIEATA